jgi:hypothetical protein
MENAPKIKKRRHQEQAQENTNRPTRPINVEQHHTVTSPFLSS